LELEILRGLSDIDAGIVDEDIDAAELALDLLDHASDRRLVRDVGDHRDRPDTACSKLGSRSFRLGRVAPHAPRVGAGAARPARNSGPDPAIAAGDDGGLAPEVEQPRHGRWLCQIRISPSAESAAP